MSPIYGLIRDFEQPDPRHKALHLGRFPRDEVEDRLEHLRRLSPLGSECGSGGNGRGGLGTAVPDPSAAPPRPGPLAPSAAARRCSTALGRGGVCFLLGWGIATETRTSYLQSRSLSRWVADMKFTVRPGSSRHIRFPKSGPYDERLGLCTAAQSYRSP